MSSTIDTMVVSTTCPHVQGPITTLATDRLIIRPFQNNNSDLLALWSTRRQPEAMTSSNSGTPDANLEVTRAKLRRLVSQIYFGIFLKNPNGTEGQIIGDGGVLFSGSKTGWPEFGYKLQKEFWGKGYTTEFALAFMEYWWSIPRKQANYQVIQTSMGAYPNYQPYEQICAWTKVDNIISEKILHKVGFEYIQDMDNSYLHYWRLTKQHYDARPQY